MADRSDEQPSADTPKASSPRENGTPSFSEQLLGEIRERLNRVEGDLSQREKRLAQSERELREAEIQLKAQHAKLSLERDRMKKLFASRLSALEEQLAEQERVLAERDKQVTRLEQSAGDAPPPTPHPVPEKQPESGFEQAADRTSLLRTAVIIGVTGLLASAGLALWVYAHYEPLYRVVGVVTVWPGDAETLAACAEQAGTYDVSVATVDVVTGVLELTIETRDPPAGTAAVDGAGAAIVARFPGPGGRGANATTRPAQAGQRDRLMQHLGEINRRLAKLASRPATDADDQGSRLLASWAAAQAEREAVEASRAALSEKSEGQGLDEASLRPDPARLKAAEQADRQLQAEMEALNQREAELADTLRELLADADDHFDALSRASAAGDARANKALEGNYDESVRGALGTIRRSIADWSQASSVLATVWHDRRESLADSGAVADLLDCQGELDRAARTFVNDTNAALVSFSQALESIGEDSDQPTKALVLRAALTRELQTVVDARQRVESIARSVVLTDNLDLAATVQRVAGLRRRVSEQRSRLEASVRREMAGELRARHERQIRAERERLNQRAAALDQEITKCVADARALIARGERERPILTEMIERERDRADTFQAIAAVERSIARELADAANAPEPVQVHYVPARAALIGPFDDRLIRALLVGGGSLPAWLVVGVGVQMFRSRQRSRRAIEACTRELEAMRNDE